MSGRVAPPHIEGQVRWNDASRKQKFLRNRDGNIAMLFAIMASVLFLFIGGSVDYVRYNSLRADYLQSLDAASLAIVRMEEKHGDWTADELVEYGEKFFIENSKNEGVLLKSDHTAYATISDVVSFDLASDETKVKACIEGSVATHLLAVVNINYFEVSQCSTITKAGAGRVELALVLDMTGSMRVPPGGIGATGDSKMVSLQKAVTSMLDAMYGDETKSDNIKVGVVPFNNYTNPGKASSWDPAWGDLGAQALYHGARFVHTDEDGTVDATTKVNHYRLYESDDGSPTDVDWSGCVESRPYPLDELDIPPGTAAADAFITAAMAAPSATDEPNPEIRKAFTHKPSYAPDVALSDLTNVSNTRFVPIFLGDDPDCDAPDSEDRCALSGGVPFWTKTGLVNRFGVPLPVHFYRNYYSRPELPGVPADATFSEDQYRQRDYIDDELYIGSASGDIGAAYAYALQQFRRLRLSVLPAVNDQIFKDRMLKLGVRSDGFFDSGVSNPTDNADLDYDEYIFRGAYVGWWNNTTQTYEFKYDLPKDDPTYQPGDPACALPILPMTDDRLLIDGGDSDGDGFPDGGAVGALYGTGETNIPNGLMWGWRVVSDGLPFTESTGPSDIGPNGTRESDWRRAVVIMTDGENTVYERDTHWKSTGNSYGYALEERMGTNIDSASDMKQEMDNKLRRICRRMKQDRIQIYSVVFDVAAGSNVDDLMKSCATQPISPYYFNVTDGDDLKEAFEDIAAQLTSLHVSE